MIYIKLNNFKIDGDLYDEFDNYIRLELVSEFEKEEEYEIERRGLDVYRECDVDVS